MSQNMKESNNSFGFAKMQIALANSFYYGSIHHQQAMEIMTHSSFQKRIINQKVGAKRKELKKSTVALVEVKWQTGCAIPKVGCPLGINDVMTLPHQVETDQWNCFSENVKNILTVLGQSNDRIEDNLYLH